MDYIIELLVELVLEGTYEFSSVRSIPKWLRYPLIAIVLIIIFGTSGLIITTGILCLKEFLIPGILLILFGVFFLLYAIYRYIHFHILRNPKSKPSKEFTKFIEDICTKKLEDLNEIQKNAVLCFYYDREMNIGGHVGYFDNYPKITTEELEQALNIVSNKKYVDNFKEAVVDGKADN